MNSNLKLADCLQSVLGENYSRLLAGDLPVFAFEFGFVAYKILKERGKRQ